MSKKVNRPYRKLGRPFNTEGSFFEYVAPEPNCGCWLWLGDTARGGYGRFHYGYKREAAHRFAYRMFVGEIPEGQIVLHSCDIPCCVNPDHLRVGTHIDNQADAIKRKRHTTGTKHGATKLTEDDVRAIRAASGRQVDIGQQFGLSQSAVWAIRARKTWRHIP